MIRHEEFKEKFNKGVDSVRENILDKRENLQDDLSVVREDIEEGVSDLKEHLSDRWVAEHASEAVEEVDPAKHKTSAQYDAETGSYDGSDY